jgi:poly(3-hydroxybutyrate) depolymerase
MFEELTRWYGKPEFGIKDVQIEDKTVLVSENVVLSKVFGGLLHFTRNALTLRTAASGPL